MYLYIVIYVSHINQWLMKAQRHSPVMMTYLGKPTEKKMCQTHGFPRGNDLHKALQSYISCSVCHLLFNCKHHNIDRYCTCKEIQFAQKSSLYIIIVYIYIYVFYHIILYHIILSYIRIYSIISYHVILYIYHIIYIPLRYITFYSILFYSILFCSVLFDSILLYVYHIIL